MSELDKDPPIQFDSDPEPDPDPIFLSFNDKLWVYQKKYWFKRTVKYIILYYKKRYHTKCGLG